MNWLIDLFILSEEEITKLKASKVNEPAQEEETDAMMEQGTQVALNLAR